MRDTFPAAGERWLIGFRVLDDGKSAARFQIGGQRAASISLERIAIPSRHLRMDAVRVLQFAGRGVSQDGPQS
jgi:hypothetical protein